MQEWKDTLKERERYTKIQIQNINRAYRILKRNGILTSGNSKFQHSDFFHNTKWSPTRSEQEQWRKQKWTGKQVLEMGILSMVINQKQISIMQRKCRGPANKNNKDHSNPKKNSTPEKK